MAKESLFLLLADKRTALSVALMTPGFLYRPIDLGFGAQASARRETFAIGTPRANVEAMRTKMMRSLRITKFGPPSVLQIEQIAIPEPGEGEVLVQVKAAAINPSDVGNVAGRFKNTTL